MPPISSIWKKWMLPAAPIISQKAWCRPRTRGSASSRIERWLPRPRIGMPTPSRTQATDRWRSTFRCCPFRTCSSEDLASGLLSQDRTRHISRARPATASDGRCASEAGPQHWPSRLRQQGRRIAWAVERVSPQARPHATASSGTTATVRWRMCRSGAKPTRRLTQRRICARRSPWNNCSMRQ